LRAEEFAAGVGERGQQRLESLETQRVPLAPPLLGSGAGPSVAVKAEPGTVEGSLQRRERSLTVLIDAGYAAAAASAALREAERLAGENWAGWQQARMVDAALEVLKD
jgi:hypothetical protein